MPIAATIITVARRPTSPRFRQSLGLPFPSNRASRNHRCDCVRAARQGSMRIESRRYTAWSAAIAPYCVRPKRAAGRAHRRSCARVRKRCDRVRQHAVDHLRNDQDYVENGGDGESVPKVRGRMGMSRTMMMFMGVVIMIIVIVCVGHFSKIITAIPRSTSRPPSTAFSYCSSTASFKRSKPARLSHVNVTMPASVATASTPLRSRNPVHP